ncbi:hexokinase-3 isoform X2 [Motacilla alba alba]|uniref:hexokinase-3 isoform X2 n=1 Tax=Motacilla alba alba TaxID=1094192 RepID=UPI0018D503CE|nr:hexokinase-3 isoform X2 [Motacilla alba alba]
MGSRGTQPRSQNGRSGGADRADQSMGAQEQDSRLWGPSPSAAPPLGPMTVMGQSVLLHDRRGSLKILHRDENMDTSLGMEIDSRFSASNLSQRRDSSHSTPIQRALRALSIPLERLHVMKGHMMQDMCKGLSRQTHAEAKVRMLPTYICSTPNGTEKGNFLVVELCQNQVRTLLVTLYGDGNLSPQMMYKIYDLPEGITQGEGEALFDFIAQCVVQFLAETTSSDTNGAEQYLPLGFVFPFTCLQTQLDKAELLSWSKGFNCSGVVGKDVVQLLQAAIDKRAKPDKEEAEGSGAGSWLWKGRKSSQSAPSQLRRVEVVALMNDTVGTMMTCSLEGRACEVAVVADKGSNCCFMAEAYLVEMTEETSGRMCVNTEWGCFGDDGTLNDLFTSYDQSVDEESSNPGEKRFEKMVGTLYLGEIVRHVLIALTAEKAIFAGTSAAVLKEKGVFTMQHLLEIANNEDGSTEVKRILEALGLQPSERDCGRVQQICRAVLGRAATLHATGLAAILSYMCQTRDMESLMVSVGVEGELFTGYPRFEEILLSVSRLLSPECMATILASRDGSGRGAAMVTAVALRLAAQRRAVDEVLAPLRLSRDDLVKVQALMREEMDRGLDKETNASASVRMLPTYVNHTPDGTEKGDFLALDLGGTNFRVLVVRITEDGITMASEIYVIPVEIMQGTGEELFDHIIDCIIDFQTKQNLVTQMLPLGFTFSFPCKQVGLDKALLLTWTKGFSASGCVGQDVVQLLRDAAKRKRHLGMQVVALVNDTVGTMMACGYDDPKCEIGLIVGTGTNACYMEEMKNVGTAEGDQGRMCINMEWGAFGDNGCLDHLFTHFDKVVDESTINPGKQRFEKLISGMYLGEIVRQILLVMTEKELLFQSKPCPKLQTKDIFKTKFLSTIELNGLALRQIRAILNELEIDASFEDSVLMKEVCQTVSLRAAQLCAAGLAAVVEKMRENRGVEQLDVTVGVDGTLYKLHPCFSKNLQTALKDLAPKCNVTFMLSEDGSGKGAALVAAVADRAANAME